MWRLHPLPYDLNTTRVPEMTACGTRPGSAGIPPVWRMRPGGSSLTVRGRMRRVLVQVTDCDRVRLTGWVRAGTTPQRVARRARIVLLASELDSATAVARALGISPRTAMLWPKRYAAGGPDALWQDAPGRGRPATISSDVADRARDLLAGPPPAGGRWTIRSLAATLGLSRSSAHRLVRVARARTELKPQRSEAAGGTSAA